MYHSSLKNLTSETYLDGEANAIYAFNVFGEPFVPETRNPFLENIFKKFNRMLISGGQVVIGEILTPDESRHILSLPFTKYGFGAPHIYSGLEECRKGLVELRFNDPLPGLMGVVMKGTQKTLHKNPFILLLTKHKELDTHISEV